jgi:hypothetical protein
LNGPEGFFYGGTKIVRKKADTFSIYYLHDGNSGERGSVYIERSEVFDAIELERERQEEIHPMPIRKNSEDADVKAVQAMLFHNDMLAILTEEFLEVVRAIQGDGNLKDELVQTASVCCRWLENLK